MDENVILSFCIPTYNRANRVCECVNEILKYKGNEIEVVVSDNNSPDSTYEDLKKISDSRFFYYRNDSNLGVGKNVINTFKKAKGKYVFLMSDEDFVNIELIPKILEILKSNKGLSILTGSIQFKESQKYYWRYKNSFFKKGSQALLGFAFKKNYFSGSIYNKELIDFDNIWNDLYVCKAYPNLCVEVLLCLKGDVHTIANPICFYAEQEKESYIDKLKGKNFNDFEPRLEQHRDFTQIVKGIEIDFVTKVNLYAFLCYKLIYNVSIIKQIKNKKNEEMLDLLARAKQFAMENIFEIAIENSVVMKLENYIEQVFNQFAAPYL
ncbi:glycosyltransferase family 2 protein [Anaeromicrobium sediminis]|uniref:Glycosyltransferase 2-like domain-containing protein n=1 Tax=Anaeromicrobium sediminis TaxID=1478221 RepID=A0A267MPJ8_9FIRM|nr:glycosyltransferase family 2 protein [Anaeromicrobium sediminis]PAB60650.1 hypothetical protein CCE28_03665 [Anaeromicrobium sediminis]